MDTNSAGVCSEQKSAEACKDSELLDSRYIRLSDFLAKEALQESKDNPEGQNVDSLAVKLKSSSVVSKSPYEELGCRAMKKELDGFDFQ